MTQKKPHQKLAVLKTEDPIEGVVASVVKAAVNSIEQPDSSGLITVPNPILRKKSKLITDVTPAVRALAEKLTDYMLDHKHDNVSPVSISAPQFSKNIQLVLFYRNPLYRERTGVEVIINPTLSKHRKYTILRETCLSLPGRAFYVKRAAHVKMTCFNLDGNLRTYKGHDILAQVFQHEVDHLNGLLIDKTGKLV